MKELYRFDVSIEKTVDEVNVKTEGGQVITTQSKVKKLIPHTFVLKRPARGELDSLRLFIGSQINRAITNGMLTKAVLVNKHIDGAGALLSTETAKRIIALSERIDLNRNELVRIGSATTEDTKQKQEEFLLKIIEDQKELQAIESSNQAIFSNTAESYAQERGNIWLILNQTYIIQNNKPEPFFKGKNFEEKENSYFDLEEADDPLLLASREKLALYWGLFSLGEANTPEEFQQIEQKLNDYASRKDGQESTAKNGEPEAPTVESTTAS